MKVLITALVFIIFYGCNKSDSNVNLKVKECKQNISLFGKENITSQKTFNHKNSDIKSSHKYSYDDKGNVLKEIYNCFTCQYKNDYVLTKTYDQNSNILTKMIDYSKSHPYKAMDLSEPDTLKKVRVLAPNRDEFTVYTYNKDGKVLTESVDFCNNGTIEIQISYAYDDFGNILTEIQDRNTTPGCDFKGYFGPDHSGYHITYTYDQNGRRLTKEHITNRYSQNIKYIYNSKYFYDLDNLSKVLETYVNESFESIYEYTYNESKKLLSEKKYSIIDGRERVSLAKTNIYDNDGNILVETVNHETKKYSYDGNNNTVTIFHTRSDNNYTWSQNYKYDEYANLLEVYSDINEGQIVCYSYD